MEWILGGLVTALSLLSVFVGMPMQIHMNRQVGRCGQTLFLIVLTLVLLLSRIAYLVLREAWLLLPSDVIGLFLWGIILLQYRRYGPLRAEDCASQPKAQESAPEGESRLDEREPVPEREPPVLGDPAKEHVLMNA